MSSDFPAVPAPSSSALAIDLFGGFAAAVHGAPLRKLRTRQGNRLLALLALAEGRELERATLAARLWPDSTTGDGAIGSLRRTLTDLRDALGAEAGRLVSVSQFTLRLDLSGDATCDVRTFDRAIAEGTPAALDRAIDLYRGPLMPDLDAVEDADGALRSARDGRHQAFLHALHQRAGQRQADRQFPGAIADLRRLLAADPTREAASRALMELLATEAADRAGAMTEYLRLRRDLKRQLGAKPEPATRALYERIQVGDSVKDGSRPTTGFRNLHNMPARLTRFIGREAEVRAIRGLLRVNRLLTLTGTGGAGKTRLGQYVAAQVVDDYPDGAWQVELAPIAAWAALDNPSLIARAVATSLGLKEQAGQSADEAIVTHLKAKRLLLLLDNGEHVLQPCASLVAAVLSACPQVSVLATSREPLGIFGEQTYRVPSLSLPTTRESTTLTATRLLSYEAVRLFADRASLATPGFEVTDGNAPLVARLCQRLDGIPLALELAAARTRSVPIEQMVERLDDRFRLLTVGDRTALPRQQTLRALVDWSYDLLTGDEKTLFARLSVFAGGWTRDAAETVCGVAPLAEHDVPDLLASLVDKSLVQRSDAATPVRYYLLETLRQYAEEKADASAEAEEVKTRFRDWCVVMAEEADREVIGPDQIFWLTCLETDYGNLRAALEGFKSAGQGGQNTEKQTAIAQQALRLALSLAYFWSVRGYIAEARGHLAWILRAVRDEAKTTPRSNIGSAFCAAGNFAYQQGDFDEARAQFTESLTIYRALDEQKNVAHLLGSLGVLATTQKDWATAWTLMKEALDVARALGDQKDIAAALCNLGHVATNQGENGTAWELLTEALENFRAIGENHGIALTLNNLGDVALAQGDYASAHPLFEESLVLRRSLEDRRGISFSLRSLAEVCLKKDDAQKAVVLWSAADALRESIGLTLPPVDQAKYEQGLDRARAALIAFGEPAFTAAWDRGRAMPWEQAVAYALGERDDEDAEA